MDIREFFDSLNGKKIIEEAITENHELVKGIVTSLGKPVLIKDYNGKSVISNIYGDRKSLSERFNLHPRELLGSIADAINNPCQPLLVDDAPFLSNCVEDVDLYDLPIPRFYSCTTAPYITSSIFVSPGDESNLSYHRIMILSKNRCTVRLCKRDLHSLYEREIETHGYLPVAISIGVPPEVAIAAAISVNPEIDEYNIASALSRGPEGNEPQLELYRLENGCRVPVASEYVLCGRLLNERDEEGPFVDITGTLDGIRQQPVLIIDKIFHRDSPIFHAIIPAGLEHYLLMGMPREARIFEVLRNNNIDVKDIRLSPGGSSWLHGIVCISKKNDNDGLIAGELALKAHSSMKHVYVVDEDIDIFNSEKVEWAMATRFQGNRDMIVNENEPGSSLDPSNYHGNVTTKIVFDATMPLIGREKYRDVKTECSNG